MSSPALDDPELTLRAAVRDVVAGAALIAIGVLTGGSSLGGEGDGVDLFFDVLGVAWIVWGLARFALRRRKPPGPPTSPGDPGRGARPRS